VKTKGKKRVYFPGTPITSSRYVRFKDERKPNKIDFFLAKVTFIDSSKRYKPHEVVEKQFPHYCKGYGPSNP
jgi:hypothetical protein